MSRNKQTSKKPKVVLWSVLTGICAVLLVVAIVGTSVAQTYATAINVALQTETHQITGSTDSADAQYFTSNFASPEDLVAHEQELCRQVEGEGAVLLLNRNDALPLKDGARVSLFSHSSVDLMYGGTGSGSVDTSSAATLKSAMLRSGAIVNETLWDFYSSEEIHTAYKRGIPQGIADDYTNSMILFAVNEVPWSKVTAAASDSFASYGDAAIVVLARSGGEGSDLPSGDNGSGLDWIYSPEGDGNYLALTAEEKDMLAGLRELKDQGVFQKIVVLLNSSNAIELDFLEPEICGVDYGVDACMWIGDVGNNGIEGVADLLMGKINPSGSLVDTYCYDNLTSPAIVNFYSQLYTNWEEKGLSYGDNIMKNYNVTNSYSIYQEGIYVGYRYYETRYEDVVMGVGNAGAYDYASTVAYPFGYGLSYTSFQFSDYSVLEKEDGFDVTVTVTNTGDVAGKKTVQIYFQSPYTDYDKQNQIEKASIELCGYAKTAILEPGASETVTIHVPKTELRAFDAYGAGTYILDAGDYYFTAAENAHAALNNVLAAKGYTKEDGMTADGDSSMVFEWTQESLDTEIFSTSVYTGNPITNLLDEADPNRSSTSPGAVTYLSRNDWVGTFPTTSKRNLAATDAMVEALAYRNYNAADYDTTDMPTTGKEGEMTLIMLRGKEYDDPMWEDLLDQCTFEEMCELIGVGGHVTAAMPSIAKPATRDENGPVGVSGVLFGGASGMCYTSSDVLAATFNDELVFDVGRCMGEDALILNFAGLYGPATNIHRTPYSGRNYEYYSEDPFIASHICKAHVEGIQTMGMYVYLKHFAINDSETYRLGIANWLNEQAAREIYIQAFETPIAEGKAWSVMESLSRLGCKWSGEIYGLQTGILRDEWGMRGACLTDYSGFSWYQDVCDGLMAGTDIWDSTNATTQRNELLKYENDPVIVTAARQATHRVLYMVVNSMAMNGFTSDMRIVSITPWWETALLALQITFGVLTVGCGTMLVVTIMKKKKAGKYPAAEKCDPGSGGGTKK